MLDIGGKIKARREELGMTQDELAKKTGYKSRSSINKIERGGNDLPQSKIVAFAIALNTTPTHLMGWDEDYLQTLEVLDNIIDYNYADSQLKKDHDKTLEILEADKIVSAQYSSNTISNSANVAFGENSTVSADSNNDTIAEEFLKVFKKLNFSDKMKIMNLALNKLEKASQEENN